MKFPIIQNRKYSYLLSGLLILVSILSLIAWGLKPGLDFTGGSMMELEFTGSRPEISQVQETFRELNLGETSVQPAGADNLILKFKEVTEDDHQKILSFLTEKFETEENIITENRFESIGPVIGEELKNKSWLAIIIASLFIIIYIAFAFRKVSKPIASWKFGVTAILALIHDIIIIAGLFSILGRFYGIEIDTLFITALLTIMGFSVHDTIVVFDRTRENLGKFYSGKFDEVVNDSINQTIIRSINTSFTTLIVMVALFIFGGDTIKNFALALLLGILVGTYSSIFVASALLVDWQLIDKRLRK
jgi:preprotein translocase subunit SecF